MLAERIVEGLQPRESACPELNAYCRGFLLVKDKSMENALAFCRGFLFALHRKRDAGEDIATVYAGPDDIFDEPVPWRNFV